MQAYKWVIAFVLFLCLGIGGFSMAVAAATGPLSVPQEPATLHKEAGAVDLKKSGAADWISVTEDVTVAPGDSIKTDPDGEASVNLYDQGILRLDHNTEITLTNALWDADEPDVFVGSVFISTGRLWSRLFNFVSPNSGFDVRTESAVATVRGTVFSVSAMPDGGTWVYVDDHNVRVKTPSDSLTLATGEHAQIEKADGAFSITRKSIPDSAFAGWIQKNRTADKKYDDDVRARWRAKLLHFISWTRVAEALKLASTLNHDQKVALAERFELRNRLLKRLVSENRDVVTAPEPQAAVTTTTVTSVGEIRIEGLPGGTQVIPITPSPPSTITTTTTPETTPAPAPTPKPISLAITSKVTSVTAGSQTLLTALLTYDDGHTEDVSKDVNWDVLPDAQGYTAGDMISNIFVASNRGGTATVRATFTGAVLRYQDTLDITVTSPGTTIAPLN